MILRVIVSSNPNPVSTAETRESRMKMSIVNCIASGKSVRARIGDKV